MPKARSPDARAFVAEAGALNLASLNELPDKIPLHPFGEFTVNGEPFLFDDESLAKVQAIRAEYGADWVLDYEHDFYYKKEAKRLGEDVDLDEIATAGWVSEIFVENGFVYGKVKWTKKAAEEVLNGEHKYISPVYLSVLRMGKWHVQDYDCFGVVKQPGTFLTKQIARLERIVHEKEKSMSKTIATIAMAAALAMPNEATEDEIISEVSSLKKGKAELLTLTAAKNTDEALATLASWKANSEQLAVVQADLASVKKEQTDAKVSALLSAAEAEFKITPAQKAAYATDEAYAHWREKPELLEKHLSALLPIVQGKEAKTKPADNPNAQQITLAAAVREVKASNPDLNPVAAVVAARAKYPQLKGEVN